jgi:heme-degrading monooxygenase HmoA
MLGWRRECGATSLLGTQGAEGGTTMYARTSTWIGSPEVLERWAEHVTTKVAPMVAGLPGNASAYFLIDREGGTAVTLTLWESEEAAAASDVAAEQSRERTLAATGITLESRGRYEVIHEA